MGRLPTLAPSQDHWELTPYCDRKCCYNKRQQRSGAQARGNSCRRQPSQPSTPPFPGLGRQMTQGCTPFHTQSQVLLTHQPAFKLETKSRCSSQGSCHLCDIMEPGSRQALFFPSYSGHPRAFPCPPFSLSPRAPSLQPLGVLSQ